MGDDKCSDWGTWLHTSGVELANLLSMYQVARNYAGLLAARIFVGLPEACMSLPARIVSKLNDYPQAAFYPGAIYLLSRWYTRRVRYTYLLLALDSTSIRRNWPFDPPSSTGACSSPTRSEA